MFILDFETTLAHLDELDPDDVTVLMEISRGRTAPGDKVTPDEAALILKKIDWGRDVLTKNKHGFTPREVAILKRWQIETVESVDNPEWTPTALEIKFMRLLIANYQDMTTNMSKTEMDAWFQSFAERLEVRLQESDIEEALDDQDYEARPYELGQIESSAEWVNGVYVGPK